MKCEIEIGYEIANVTLSSPSGDNPFRHNNTNKQINENTHLHTHYIIALQSKVVSSGKSTFTSTEANICRLYPQAAFSIDTEFYLLKQKVRNIQTDKQGNDQLLRTHTQTLEYPASTDCVYECLCHLRILPNALPGLM